MKDKKYKRVKIVGSICVGCLLVFSVIWSMLEKSDSIHLKTVRNEVFTEQYFDGLTGIQSVTPNTLVEEEETLENLCNMLAELPLEEYEQGDKLNMYGGYFYRLFYKDGQEKSVSLMGMSDTQMIVNVDGDMYITEEKIPEFLEEISSGKIS